MRLIVPIADSSPAAHADGYPIDIIEDLPGPTAAVVMREVLSPKARRLLIVSDDNVAPLYAPGLEAALQAAGYDPATLVLPAGEATKSMATIERVLAAAFDHKLSRSDAMVALGGGVIGDITGFAAAIFQRGIGVVQVPTTLLAQVDSSVGGKTGVNHERGKNLIGAFWQPRAVIASQAVLYTLPTREVRCGLAEAVKHAFIADPELLADIVRHITAFTRADPVATERLVASCCRIKSEVVASDPREDPITGRRAILNFGHTFGHAYEKLLGYGHWTHGEAVSVGMVWAARLSERLGFAAAGLEAEIRSTLVGLGLPADPEAPGLPSLSELIEAAKGDKKGDSSEVRFVLLARIGEPLIERLRWEAIAAALRDEGGGDPQGHGQPFGPSAGGHGQPFGQPSGPSTEGPA